nr:hypothetical protein [Sphingomonas sp. Ant H11]
MNGKLVDALEAIGVERAAVLLLPDDLLRIAQARQANFIRRAQEAAQRSKHPDRTGLGERIARQAEPAFDTAVPTQRRVAIGRIAENHVERAVIRHDGAAVADKYRHSAPPSRMAASRRRGRSQWRAAPLSTAARRVSRNPKDSSLLAPLEGRQFRADFCGFPARAGSR